MSIRQMFLGNRAQQIPEDLPPDDDESYAGEQRTWQHAVYVVRRDPLALFGVAWLSMLVIMALFGPVLAPIPIKAPAAAMWRIACWPRLPTTCWGLTNWAATYSAG